MIKESKKNVTICSITHFCLSLQPRTKDISECLIEELVKFYR